MFITPLVIVFFLVIKRYGLLMIDFFFAFIQGNGYHKLSIFARFASTSREI